MKVFDFLFLSWVLLPVSIFGFGSQCIPDPWTKISGSMTYVVTSADNEHLWGIDTDGHPYHKGGQPDDVWTSVECEYALKSISVSGDGSVIWAIAHHEYLLRREGLYGVWQVIPNDAKNWQSVSISADGNHVAGLDEADNVWNREYPGPWERRTGDLLHIALTGDGEFGWGVDRDNYVYYRNGYKGKWVRVSGRLKYISVSADGQHVWGVNSNDIIFYRKGKHDYWKDMHMHDNMHGRAKQITVSGDGAHVYSVDRNNEISYLPGYPGYLRRDEWVSVNIPGGLKEVSISNSGNHIYGLDNKDVIWHTEGHHDQWRQVPGAALSSISVAGDDVLWGSSLGETVYRDGADAVFETVRGKMHHFAASTDGNHIWAIAKNALFYRNGRNGSWTSAGVRAKRVSVSGDGSHVWYVDNNDNVWYRNGFSGTPYQESGSLKQISVSADGNHIWGVDSDSFVHYRAGKAGTWMQVEGAHMEQVSVSGNGSIIYGVQADGTTYSRHC